MREAEKVLRVGVWKYLKYYDFLCSQQNRYILLIIGIRHLCQDKDLFRKLSVHMKQSKIKNDQALTFANFFFLIINE